MMVIVLNVRNKARKLLSPQMLASFSRRLILIYTSPPIFIKIGPKLAKLALGMVFGVVFRVVGRVVGVV